MFTILYFKTKAKHWMWETKFKKLKLEWKNVSRKKELKNRKTDVSDIVVGEKSNIDSKVKFKIKGRKNDF